MYAYNFSPKQYPDITVKDLKKLPIDTFNRVRSAIERFNDVRTPDSREPSNEEKDIAWKNIVRSAETLEYDLEVKDWKDINNYKVYRSIKSDPNYIAIPVQRAFVDPQTKETYIEGVAKSNLFDSYITRWTKESLIDMANQINNRGEATNPFKVILESGHEGSWERFSMGYITNAWTMDLDDETMLLHVRAKLDPDHPFTPYLVSVLNRQRTEEETNMVDEFPTPFIALSVNGFVTDWEFDEDLYREFEQQMPEYNFADFKKYEGKAPIIIKAYEMTKIAITNKPADYTTFVSNLVETIRRENDKETITSREVQNTNEEYVEETGDQYMENNLDTNNVPVTNEQPAQVAASTDAAREDAVQAPAQVTTENETVTNEEQTQPEAVVTEQQAEGQTEPQKEVQEVNLEDVLNEVNKKVEAIEAQVAAREAEAKKEAEKEQAAQVDLSIFVSREEHENLKENYVQLQRSYEDKMKKLEEQVTKMGQAFIKLHNALEKEPVRRAAPVDESVRELNTQKPEPAKTPLQELGELFKQN